MAWAIAVLLGAAVLLLIFSTVKSQQSAKNAEQQIEEITFTFTNELKKLQQQIRNLELDAEITAVETGLQPEFIEHRQLLRDLLDMQKRGYSIDSIAANKQMSQTEIEHMLSPFIEQKNERRKVVHGV